MANGNLLDLFLAVSQTLVDHPLDTIRVAREARIDYAFWEPFFPLHRSPIALVRDVELIERLRRALEEAAPGALALRVDAHDSPISALIAFLRVAAPTVAAYLKKRDELTYPSLPGQRLTIVRRDEEPLFETLRKQWPRDRSETPPIRGSDANDFTFALALDGLYLVEPLAGNATFNWSVRRPSERFHSSLELGDPGKIALLSYHCCFDARAFERDCEARWFRVREVSEESALIASLRGALDAIARQNVGLILCPELTASPAVRTEIRDFLNVAGRQVVFCCPGSWHEQQGRSWRNRCRMFGPTGIDEPEFYHDKIAPYLATERTSEALGCAERLWEKIDGAHRRLVIWDLPGLGRVVVLICIDLLDEAVRGFLRRHWKAVDHLFVLAMSPSLGEFAATAPDLGRWLDAGIYVANACHGTEDEAAYVYLPYRGAQKHALHRCETLARAQHRICVRVLDLSTATVVHLADF